MPQEPFFGPIGWPSSRRVYSVGRLGAAPSRRHFSSWSTSRIDASSPCALGLDQPDDAVEDVGKRPPARDQFQHRETACVECRRERHDEVKYSAEPLASQGLKAPKGYKASKAMNPASGPATHRLPQYPLEEQRVGTQFVFLPAGAAGPKSRNRRIGFRNGVPDGIRSFLETRLRDRGRCGLMDAPRMARAKVAGKQYQRVHLNM